MSSLDDEYGWEELGMHENRVKEEYELGLGGGNDPVGRQEADQNREVIGDQLDLVVDRDMGLVSPRNQGTIMESPNNMKIMPSSQCALNLAKDTQNALFQDQLEEIDNELTKFDNVDVKGGEYGVSEVNIHLGPLKETKLTRLDTLGLTSSPVAIKEKGKKK